MFCKCMCSSLLYVSIDTDRALHDVILSFLSNMWSCVASAAFEQVADGDEDGKATDHDLYNHTIRGNSNRNCTYLTHAFVIHILDRDR